MADYIKREDALQAVIDCWEPWFGSKPAGDIVRCPYSAINKIPSADVAEVVRCKDCRHRDPEDHKCDCGQLERAGCVFPVNDDYFCAYGER